MDMVFFLEEEIRSAFIRSVLRILHWRYICVWSYQPYLPPCLLFLDGYYDEEAVSDASSSAGSFGRRLFDAYCGTACAIDSGFPGLVFKEGSPYLMLGEASLQCMATTEAQMQFYQGAGIKNAVFLACRSGVIELGTSSNEMNLEMEEISNLFTEDKIRQLILADPRKPQERSRASSSSSPLQSVSIGSPDTSSLQPNIVTPLPFQGPMRNSSTIHLYPNAQMVDAKMIRAMLVVLSSSTSATSSSSSSLISQLGTRGSAFQRYSSAISPSVFLRRSSLHKQSLLKLSIAILRAINNQRRNQAEVKENQPTASQLSHVISERKRREKLNESFQALRALLPPGSKKAKVSILSGARETLVALKAEISELKLRNQILQAQTSLPTLEARRGEQESTSGEGREVTVTEISSTPEEREIELRARKRGQFGLMDLILRLLVCIRSMNDVELTAVSAELQQEQHQSIIVLRLKIKGRDWSKHTFEEMIAREFVD